MTIQPSDYDPRYLAGIVLFNRGDFFEAHDVWEDLWADTAGPDKRFVQGLIQAAVGLCHFCNENTRGAVKLYRTSRDYMERVPSPHLGLDIADFWQRMDRCFAPLLQLTELVRMQPDVEALPTIELDPPPAAWPRPEDYLEHEE